MLDLKWLKELHAKATPGKWKAELSYCGGKRRLFLVRPGMDGVLLGQSCSLERNKQHEADTVLAAEAHNALPELISRLEKSEARVEELETSLAPMILSENPPMAGFKGIFARAFLDSFVAMFEENGGKNFLCITLENSDGTKKYDLTIQNCHMELTSAEKLSDLTAKVQELARDLSGTELRCISLDAELDLVKKDLAKAAICAEDALRLYEALDTLYAVVGALNLDLKLELGNYEDVADNTLLLLEELADKYGEDGDHDGDSCNI